MKNTTTKSMFTLQSVNFPQALHVQEQVKSAGPFYTPRVVAQRETLEYRLPNCREFSHSIFKIAEKLRFNADLGYWQRHYVWLDEESTVRQADLFRNQVGDCPIINKKKLSTLFLQRALEKMSDQCNGDPRLAIFTGAKGAGKSAYLKHLAKTNAHKFIKAKIIPSRIEYSRARDHNAGQQIKDEKESNKANLLAATRDCFARDALHLVFCDLLHREHEDNYDIFKIESQKCRKKLKVAALAAKDKAIGETFLRIHEESIEINSHSEFMIMFSRLRVKEKSELIRFCHEELGFRFLAIYDGFDLITAEDFMRHIDKKELLSTVVDLFHKSDGQGILLEDEPRSFLFHRWLAVRKETYTRIAWHGIHRKGQTIEYFAILPPTFESVRNSYIESLTNDHFYGAGWPEGIHEFFIKLDEIAKQRFNIQDWSSIFNGNVRQFKDFISSTILLFFYVLPQRQFWASHHVYESLHISDLLNAYRDFDTTDVLQVKYYRLSQLMLCRVGNRPCNRAILRYTKNNYVVDDAGDVEGVIDNIFNYTLDVGATGCFLQKARICLLVTKFNYPLGVAAIDICHQYEREYGEPPLGADEDISLLCRVGFLCSTINDSDVILYYIDRRGKYVLNEFVSNLIYLESIYDLSFIPQSFHDFVTTIDRRYSELASLLIRTMLVVQYVMWLEKEFDEELRIFNPTVVGRLWKQINSVLKAEVIGPNRRVALSTEIEEIYEKLEVYFA